MNNREYCPHCGRGIGFWEGPDESPCQCKLEMDRVRDALKSTQAEVEQLRVQLAGCSVAALGGTNDPAKKGDWGWSPAYQDVLDLRLKYDDPYRLVVGKKK